MTTFRQRWELPSNPRPIVIIDAGGIVRDAHLPAYRKAGLTVAGLYDLDAARASELAGAWDIGTTFASLAEATARGNDVVYDLALPPTAITGVLPALPKGSSEGNTSELVNYRVRSNHMIVRTDGRPAS